VGSKALVATPDALAGFQGATPTGSTWRNELAARVGLHLPFYRPARKARRIACPILFCLASRDVITPPGPAREAAARAPLAEIKEYDALHFDISVGETFQQVIRDELDFLARHLPT
jgi:pimeloyl-ACP methyl ester carboxylesterase